MNALFFENPARHRLVAAQFENIAQRAATHSQTPDGARGTNSGQSWSPAIDVVETDAEIVLHAEVPGMTRAQIEVQLDGETLSLRGERLAKSNTGEENFHRIERRYGRFARTFQFETPIDGANVVANLNDGVLSVRLPKAASRARNIEIVTK